MNKAQVIFLALAVSISVNAQKDFKPLFNGNSTEGWHTYGKKVAGTDWRVEDGILFLEPGIKALDQGGDLVTDQEFENFHFKCEWRVPEGANSGIIFLVKEDLVKFPNTYSSGLEMQILDNEGHADGKIAKRRAGDLYDLIESKSKEVKPAGEWNIAEIIVNKGMLAFVLNGVTIVETTLWDEGFNAIISGSKFATWKDFGTIKKGKIALQDHGNKVWFRNIMIKIL